MKKLFFMLIVLFILYLSLQLIFTIFSKGESSDYIITNNNIEFLINENSYFKENNLYSYEIKAKNNTFNFQIAYDFNKNTQVIKKIKYFNDENFECILPIFKNNLILMDIICYSNGQINYYYNLKGKNKILDEFVKKLHEYNIEQFVDTEKTEQIEGLKIYKNNLILNHYIGIDNYKGIFDISKSFNSITYNITLYNKNINNQKLSGYVDNYFISADYNKEGQFNRFNIIDLVELEVYTLKVDNLISFNSYIQGVVDSKIYLYDKTNSIQYEINVEKETIEIYQEEELKFYKDGKWTLMTKEQADNEDKFGNEAIVDNSYQRVDKIGDEEGFYYLYKKVLNGYDVYRKSIQNDKTLIYLFNTKTIDSIQYVDDYVYFINGSLLQIYNDKFGVKNLVQYKELESNKDLRFNVYSKK